MQDERNEQREILTVLQVTSSNSLFGKRHKKTKESHNSRSVIQLEGEVQGG